MVNKRQRVTLRTFLKQATSSSHDRLDRQVSAFDFANRHDYAAFLRFQLCARAPIERWVAANCSQPWQPPRCVMLLQQDLVALGASPPEVQAQAEANFDPGVSAHPLGIAWGIAWSIAGSHLGNRSILHQMPRNGIAGLPTAFLDNPEMDAFWRGLRPQLEVEADDAVSQGALVAAEAVFACFADALELGRTRAMA